MKQNHFTTSVLLALLLLGSCTSLDDAFRLDGNPRLAEELAEAHAYQVSLRSARYFAERLQLEDQASRKVGSIDPVIQGRDTLLYFVNYEGNKGWVVLSGDKRTEAILASSTTGHIDKDALGGSATWFDDLAGRVYGLKRSKDKDAPSGDYEMWSKIDTITNGLRPSAKGLRAIPDDPEEPDYEDILVDTRIEVLVDKAVGPLIKTKWGQGFPWNTYTPTWQDTGKRCLTGCVAVAGAQMLYYFHYLKNKPRTFYSQGSCVGSVWSKHSRMYSFGYSGPSEEVWDQMALRWTDEERATDLAGLLMGFVGFHIDMDYGIEASGADDEDLVKLYQMFGIGSKYTEYDADLVRASLDNQLPVNVGAYRSRRRAKITFIKLWWIYENGHAWIIDGYKDKKVRYTYTYERLPKLKHRGNEEFKALRSIEREPSGKHGSYSRPRYGKFTTSEFNTSYVWKMNFGWDGRDDDGDYTVWANLAWDTSKGNYQYKRVIIHGFTF